MRQCQKDLPPTFANNMTGDVAFLQGEATARLRATMLQIGFPMIQPLQRMMRHTNPQVSSAAVELLKAIEYELKKPPAEPLSKTLVVHLVAQLKDPRSQTAYFALQQLRRYGNEVLQVLIEVARAETSNLHKEALGALYSLTAQLYGDDLEKWSAYVELRIKKIPYVSPSKPPIKLKNNTT